MFHETRQDESFYFLQTEPHPNDSLGQKTVSMPSAEMLNDRSSIRSWKTALTHLPSQLMNQTQHTKEQASHQDLLLAASQGIYETKKPKITLCGRMHRFYKVCIKHKRKRLKKDLKIFGKKNNDLHIAHV